MLRVAPQRRDRRAAGARRSRVLPAGGNIADGILTALLLIFLAAIAAAGGPLLEPDAAHPRRDDRPPARPVYGGLGAIALMVAGTDELFETGPGTVAWIAILAGSVWLIFTTWREANSA